MRKLKLPVWVNLLLNISGGLREADLSNMERGLLKRKFGKNWKKRVFGI